MKVLITGGCGFVGSNLAIFFKQYYTESEIYCLDNLSRRGSEINLKRLFTLGIRFIHGDVRIKSDFYRVPKVDIVIDAAAEPSVLAGNFPGELENLIDTNFSGTINTLYFAKRHQAAVIFLSTSRVYPYDSLSKVNIETSAKRFDLSREQIIQGISEKGVSENYPLEGVRSLYGATKLASEFFIKEFSNNFKIPAVINRCGVLTGPFQMGKIDQGVIVLWMAKHFWKGKLSYIGFGGMGQQVRDVLHVRDLFNLVKWQIENLSLHNGHIFNVGGGKCNSISLSELTEYCKELTGNSLIINSEIEGRPGDLPIYITDNSKINQFSSWAPEIGINEILDEIYNWIVLNENQLKPILA
jgi:CDP-paratose 2-epimerase